MKPLSESLRDPAARVKQLDESAAAVQERNRAALQKRREKLDAAIDREVQEFDETTAEAAKMPHAAGGRTPGLDRAPDRGNASRFREATGRTPAA